MRATQPGCFADLLGSNQLLGSFPAIQFKLTVWCLHSTCIQYDASCLRKGGINELAWRERRRRAAGGVLRRQVKGFRELRGAMAIAASALCCAQLIFFATIGGAHEPPSFERKAAEAFAEYVRATEARNESELKRGDGLLWIDGLPEAQRKRDYAELARGEVLMEQRNAFERGEFACPGGMIHHWEGVIFVAGARLDDVLRELEDYDRHSEYYAPDVVGSKIESHEGDHFKVFLRFRRQKVITAVLNSEHAITYFRDSATRAHSRSSATHIAEVENPGKKNEREKSRDEDNGFLWGMETWWRMEEKDGGVYVQSEAVSLTRDIPVGLGWMIGPFITGIPKETLTFTLEATRRAVLAQSRDKKLN